MIKGLVLGLTISLGSLISASAAFAGNTIQDSGARVGAEVILRQIADSKHFGKDGLSAVKAALSGQAGTTADITSFDCEPALGKDECLIHLDAVKHTSLGDVSNSFDVKVVIYQGKVISGGPVDVEGNGN